MQTNKEITKIFLFKFIDSHFFLVLLLFKLWG